MESLGDILKRIAANASLQTVNRDGARSPEDEVPQCAVCGGLGWLRRRVPLSHPNFGQLFPCDCLKERNRGELRSRLQRYSNLGHLADITFQSLRQRAVMEPGRRRLWERGLQASEEYASAPDGWLVLSGPGGSGKTSLAAAVANVRLQNEQPVFFITVPDLLDHLRSAYAPDSPMSYDQLFEQVRNNPLLVLDDLGAHNTTPWAQEKLLQVLNHRFNSKLPTVITLQCPVEDLDPAMRARLQAQPFSRIFELGPRGGSEAPLLEIIGGLGNDMLDRMTFEKFDAAGRAGSTTRDKLSLQGALAAAQNFALRNEGWLLLTGAPGCGKTHLSVAVLNKQLDEGHPCVFAFVPALLDHLRSSFDERSHISYDRELERVKRTPLLVMDDLGSEATTPWAEEKLFQIIDYRYNMWMPTVINAFSTIDVLDETRPRIASRLKDQRVNWVHIEALDYRDQGGTSPQPRPATRSAPAKPRRRAGP